MSNLQSAKSAIKAEIIHARQGLAFYESRIDVLEKTLDQLDSVIVPEKKSGMEKKTSGKRASAVKGRSSRKARTVSTGAKELPSTGGEYWLDLISSNPQSGAEILKQAVNKLGFQPTKAQVKTLRQRVAPALSSLVKAGKVQDSGNGRERRYFKA